MFAIVLDRVSVQSAWNSEHAACRNSPLVSTVTEARFHEVHLTQKVHSGLSYLIGY